MRRRREDEGRVVRQVSFPAVPGAWYQARNRFCARSFRPGKESARPVDRVILYGLISDPDVQHLFFYFSLGT